MDIIKFEGSWTEEAMHQVRRAVRQLETVLDAETPEGLVGKPWICICGLTGSGSSYVARRFGLVEAFEAPTLAELIVHLERFGREQDSGAEADQFVSLDRNTVLTALQGRPNRR